MNIFKQISNNPKLLQLINTTITAVATYFGITIYQHQTAPDVDVAVEFTAPTDTPHTHPQTPQKDWQPLIDKKMKEHIQADH